LHLVVTVVNHPHQSAAPSRILFVDAKPRIFCGIVELLDQDDLRVSEPAPNEPIEVTLDEQRPHVLILTLGRERKESLGTCMTVRKNDRWNDIPIIFVSSDPSPHARMAAFAAGADDYVAVPIVVTELLTRIRQRIRRNHWREERYENDALTGLLMRRSMLERCAGYLAQAERKHLTLTLALLDLDGLKKVNDTQGHQAGDALLAALGTMLASRFRAQDLRCRWGGDEFLLAFPGENARTIATIMEETRKEFEARYQASFSVGVASYPEDGADFDALLAQADRALYVAKRSRRPHAQA
jgi:diguanylate cyclase (GGDEF)-like protein